MNSASGATPPMDCPAMESLSLSRGQNLKSLGIMSLGSMQSWWRKPRRNSSVEICSRLSALRHFMSLARLHLRSFTAASERETHPLIPSSSISVTRNTSWAPRLRCTSGVRGQGSRHALSQELLPGVRLPLKMPRTSRSFSTALRSIVPKF